MFAFSRLRCLLFVLILFWVAGCGGGSNFPPLPNNGPAPQGGAVPPGNVISQGSGPVANQNAAVARVLNQFLGLNRDIRAQVISDAGPLVNAYIVPNGPFRAGTTVTDADDPDQTFTLDESYYLFWVDPNPLANLGHECSILYLRARDGLLVEQVVEFDPLVGGRRLLELPSVKAANLIYAHVAWRDLGAVPGQSSGQAPRQVPELPVLTQTAGVGQPGGPKIGGLGVVGSPDFDSDDTDAARDVFMEMGGEASEFDTLVDTEGSRKDGFDLEEAITKASEGLGPNDKFVFVLSSHGSENGTFCMGTDMLSWAVLCELIEQNVTAGNVNMIIDTCYAGLSIPEFEKWKDQSNKRVRIVTGTDDTPSFDDPTGPGFNLSCILDDLKEKLNAAKGDGTLTLDELEQAMANASFTQAEIDKKLCVYIGDDPPGTPIDPDLRAWKDDYEDKPGAEDKITPTTPGKTTGFDSRPEDPNQQFNDFLGQWQGAVNGGLVGEIEPFYDPNFNYNGRDPIQTLGLAPNVQVEIVALNLVSVQPITVTTGPEVFDVVVDLEIDRSTPPPVQIHQTENHMERLRLLPVATVPGAIPFVIVAQQTLEQTTFGTLTEQAIPQPLPLPSLPGIDNFNVIGPGGQLEPGDAVQLGDQLRVEAQVNGFNGIGNGNIGAVFAQQLQAMADQGGGIFSTAQFNVPPLQAGGSFLVEFFVENRDIAIQGQHESFASQSRTFELMTPPLP